MVASPLRVCVVGCGITGSTLVSRLLSLCGSSIKVDIFDQGFLPGGRLSSRALNRGTPEEIVVDHGCQFLRGDTEETKELLSSWVDKGWLTEWTPNEPLEVSSSSSPPPFPSSFFGFPSLPPFYHPTNSRGITSLVRNQVLRWDDRVTLSTSTRVTSVSPSHSSSPHPWLITTTSGKNAIHDTANSELSSSPPTSSSSYDIVVFTDVSSTTFGTWHRASANPTGLPADFLSSVKARVNSRTPLFTSIVVFESRVPISSDAITFADNNIWFASRASSKTTAHDEKDVWILICTPAFGVSEIKRVPMQTDEGEFIPQDKSYLTNGPCKVLADSFLSYLSSQPPPSPIPSVLQIDGQRWGSAMPGDKSTPTSHPSKEVLKNVPYDSSMQRLAPTTQLINDPPYVSHESGVYQAGDFMSSHSSGAEAALISALKCAEAIAAASTSSKIA